MNRALALACLALVASASAEHLKPREYYEELFFEHIQQFNLNMKDGAEFIRRIAIFASNVDMIEKHNSDVNQTFKMGINQFTHLTFDEFKAATGLNGINRPNLRRQPGDSIHSAPADVSSLPSSVDWTAKGAVTAVKDQGQCGSCWSFSTTGAMEGAYAIKYGNLPSFSEQQLVSCAPSPNEGCNGGWMDDAFVWAKSNGGLASEADYPYVSGTSQKSESCVSGKTPVSNSAPSGYVDVQAGDVNALMSAVAQQPVAIAIQANQLAFQTYKSGILTGKCGQNLDHGVLVVGYGTENGVDYWKVKNSWGPSWGEGGYIRILRSSDDLCGVLDAASYPTL